MRPTYIMPQLELDHIFPEPNMKKNVILTRSISTNPSNSQERRTRTTFASLIAHDMEDEAAKMKPTCTMPQLELNHILIPEPNNKKNVMLTRSISVNLGSSQEHKMRTTLSSKFSPPPNYDCLRSKSRRIQPVTTTQFIRSFTTKEESHRLLKRSARFNCYDFPNDMRSKKFTQYVRSTYTFTGDTKKEAAKKKLTKWSKWFKNNILNLNKKSKSTKSKSAV
ncbi:hypothetical protein ACLB2K_008263 [Fragaria x ananassa]